MKNQEFHISFIKSLVLTAIVTGLCMAFTPLVVEKLYSNPGKTQTFTTIQSHESPESRD